jgi:hypothetical protein
MSEKLRNNKFSLLDSDSDNDSDNNKNNKNIKNNENIKSNEANGNSNSKIFQNNFHKNNKSSKLKTGTNANTTTNTTTNKLEEDIINQYYGKKVINKSKTNFNNYNKYSSNDKNLDKNLDRNIEQNIEIIPEQNQNNQNNQNNENNQNDFIKVVSKKRDNRIVMECKYKEIEEDFSKLKMDNYFRVLGHHNNDSSWDYNSYHKITELHTWINLGSFFNSLNKASGECVYTDFDIFLMKNEISPMWEDNENRNGSICSIKIDSLVDGYEIFKNLTFNIANNTLLKFNPTTWNSVNGISYSSKKLDNANETYCVIIKVWFKINILNYTSVDKILNDDINQLISRYSIKNKPIKPEY